MIENSSNKTAEKVADVEPKVEITENEKTQKLYHFAGSGVYFPVAINAESIEQATEIWLKKRVPISSE